MNLDVSDEETDRVIHNFPKMKLMNEVAQSFEK